MKSTTSTILVRGSRPGNILALTALVALGISAANAADWTGASSTDWNTPGNWSGGTVPTGENAVVNNASGNIATITSDLAATPNDIIVTGGSRIDHIAGTAGTGGGSWMFVGQDSTLSIYNLANTTVSGGGISGYGQGTGTVNATGNFQLAAWGGNRVGTMNMNTVGSLNITGALRIGNDGGSVGIMNLESGGVNVANSGAVFAGTENNIGHGGGVATLNISGGFLSVSDVLRLGNEGGTGTINMTGGLITKTGNGQFLVGHNNGSGTVVQSGGTITANNELYIGNENAGASGTYTLSGTGALTVSNEVVVGRESGTGVLNVDGGTITTEGNGNMYIGRRNGTGTLNQTAGTISVNREFGVGTRDDNKIGTGTYNLSGGSLAAANNIFIGKEQGSSGTMDMTGGTMSTSDKLQIGHNQATGDLTQSGGTINVQNEVYIGNENSAASIGTYTLSGTGVLNVGNEVIVGRDNGTGTFNLDGGTVNATKISGGTGSATVNFNGGVIRAKRDEGNLIENLDTANVDNGGIKIDSNGFNVATSQALSGTGGLEKSGSGSLTLNGAHTYTGPTLVSAGTLKLELNSSITSAVTVDAGATLAGAGTVAGDLSFNSGANFVFSLTETLLVNGTSVSFVDFGIDDLVGLTSDTAVGAYTIIGGSATIDTTGLLNLGSANAFDLGGGKSAYFTEGSLVVNVVPEPSTYALLALAGLGLAGHVIRRRRS
jgi:autotransporter-associated beta strand protein/T5SS/PEP-CTERM-associated repeat protein